MSYRIYSKITDATETVTATPIRQRVYELAGRDVLGFKSVRDKLRRTGKVYIACDRNSPGAALYGRGFILEDEHA